MAGYSGTPLAKRLGIKPGHAVAVLGLAPASFEAGLELPEGAKISRQLRPTPYDVIVLFVERLADLEGRFAKVVGRLHPAGGLWIAWPKQAAKRPTDITDDVVRRVGLAGGLVDNKVCAIDDVWSGLRLVVRIENREAVAYRADPPTPRRKPRPRARAGAGGSTLRRAQARISR